MPRLIRIARAGPFRIDPADFPKDGKAIWICGCGLSKTMPYCDKTHKACAAEQPGVLYIYDDEGNIVEERAEPESGEAEQ